MVFADRISNDTWITEDIIEPQGLRSTYARRTTWRVEREGRHSVSVEATTYYTVSNGTKSGNDPQQNPSIVPISHVDEIRSKVLVFFAGDDVDVDFGPYALAKEVPLRFEEFWQGTDTVRYVGPDDDGLLVECGAEYEFRVRTLGNLLELKTEDGERVYIDGTDARLGADSWEVVADE